MLGLTGLKETSIEKTLKKINKNSVHLKNRVYYLCTNANIGKSFLGVF